MKVTCSVGARSRAAWIAIDLESEFVGLKLGVEVRAKICEACGRLFFLDLSLSFTLLVSSYPRHWRQRHTSITGASMTSGRPQWMPLFTGYVTSSTALLFSPPLFSCSLFHFLPQRGIPKFSTPAFFLLVAYNAMTHRAAINRGRTLGLGEAVGTWRQPERRVKWRSATGPGFAGQWQCSSTACGSLGRGGGGGIRCSVLGIRQRPLLALLRCSPDSIRPLVLAPPSPSSQGLLAAGAQCDAADENGWTALHFAANDGFSEAVQVWSTANCVNVCPIPFGFRATICGSSTMV